MEPNESISGMYTRFTDIVNNLKNLGKSYTDSELCKKVLDLYLAHGSKGHDNSRNKRSNPPKIRRTLRIPNDL